MGTLMLSCAVPIAAQTAASPDAGIDEDVYILNPFEISAGADTGYLATETLGGTRIRTDLRDLATPLSVVTSEFLQDTGAKDNQTLLTYTTNTEVGGLFGNWAGTGNDNQASDRGQLLRPNNNTRVRGLDEADNTRNFFLTEIPWDSYNVDRVEIQRGPNSILFGVGSPSGIINTTTIVAEMGETKGKINAEYSSFDSKRVSGDFNMVVIDDLLAVRVAAVRNDQNFRQKPAFNLDERIFATATYQPQLLPSSWADKMVIRASYESAQVESNNPRILPPVDAISLWFEDAGGDGVHDLIGFEKGVMDMFLYSQSGGGDPERGLDGDVINGRVLLGTTVVDGGGLNNGGLGFWYKNGASQPYFVSRQAPRSHPGALAADGTVDNAIDIPYGTARRMGAFSNYAYSVDRLDEALGNASRFPLATRGYYKDRSLSDESIFNFYDYLIDGDNKREFKDWKAENISVVQTFFQSRLGLEFVYDHQKYKEWRGGATWQQPYISVDINKNLQHQLSQYSRIPDPSGANADGLIDPESYSVIGFTPSASQPYANPMAGAAFISGGFALNNMSTIERETMRFTAFGEMRGSDFFDADSWLAKAIGRHVFTGLLTREEKYQTDTQWEPSSTSFEWAFNLNANKDTSMELGQSERKVTPVIYLSDPMFNRTSASGLNLGPIKTYYNPSGVYLTDYFQTTWVPSLNPADASYVDPGAPWTTLLGDPNGVQADNPMNYVGRTKAPVDILNADDGDRDQLITNYGVTEQIVDSKGIVWQGYLFDGLVVPTVGWREDTLETFTATGAKDGTGLYSTKVGKTEKALENTGETVSWGVVAHMPRKWVDKVPVLSGLSAYYNVGENSRVQARYNYDGSSLDNPSAESTDYGVVLSLFDEKLSIKIGKFETTVKNANLPGGTSILGNNQYYLYQLEAWGTANSLMYLFGREGLDPNQSWHWNWADTDSPGEGWNDAATQSWKNHPGMIAQMETVDAWIMTMDQQFFDNYAIPVNVSALQNAYTTYRSSGDIQPLVSAAASMGFNVGTYTTGFSSQNNGQINGIGPNGTIDNVSEGWEFEVNYRPISNWNIQLNAAKTDAYRESLGAPMLEHIAKQWARLQGPAGDIRLWWGGDRPLRAYYEDNIMSAVEFQQESIGFQVPELRPWRFALITNYSFIGDRLKGFNVGGAIRWQDKQILGYGFKDDLSGLSVEKPIYGDTETNVDLWAGYERSLTEKIDWRIQLNLRNVGQDVGLTPISANPDGSPAAQRITEGMTWTISNTFSF